jgi:hypothetical protein
MLRRDAPKLYAEFIPLVVCISERLIMRNIPKISFILTVGYLI